MTNRIHSLLGLMDQKINEWDAQSGKLGRDVRARWHSDRNVYCARRAELERALHGLQEAPAWNPTLLQAATAWSTLFDAFRQAGSGLTRHATAS